MKRNLLPTFNTFIELGVGQYVKKFDQTMMTVTFINGSQLMFMSESFSEDKELNRFKGLEINGAGMDEINEMQEATFNKLIERSGSWTKAGEVPPKIIGTCNPSHGWVKERFYDKWRDKKLPKGWAYVPALITDNPYVSKTYLESLRRNMPQWEYEVFVNGNWDMKLEGVLFARNELKRFSLKDYKNQQREGTLGYADIADEGDDFFSMPIADVFNKKVFITDVLFSKENIDVTLPMCASMIKKHNPEYVRVEANNQGSVFIKMLRQLVPVEKILAVSNTSHKHTRILLQYGFIKEYCYFVDDSEIVQGSDYDLFMKQILSYMKDGTSKHDDAPDSLAGLSGFCQSFLGHLFNPES